MRHQPIRVALAVVALCVGSFGAGCSKVQGADSPAPVTAILPPGTPFPTELASAGVTRFSFIGYGDTRGRRDGFSLQKEHSAVVESIVRRIKAMANGPDPVRFVLQSGDAVVNGRDARQWNVSFVKLVNRITTEGGVPYFLAPGNHDVTASDDLNSAGRKEGLANYLYAMTLLIPPDRNARRLDGYPTYAFGYGNTFVLAFDSNIASDSVQYAWIKTQLEQLDRHRYENVIAIFHHPVYSSGPHGATIVELPTMYLRSEYMPLFRKHGVKLLLTGHEHVYEHWVEHWTDSTGRERSMDEIVSGGGGAPLYSFQGEPDLRGYRARAGRDSVRVQHLVRPGAQGENAYHYVVFHVDGPRIWFDVIGVDLDGKFQPYRGLTATLSDSGPAR
jgi:hypothetical protein